MTRPASHGSIVRQVVARIADLVLGVDPTNRHLAKRGLLSVAFYAVSICGETLAVGFGFLDRLQVAWLSTYLIAGASCIYLLIRSGINRRLAHPSMVGPQVLFPLSALLFAYPISGPLRGLVLLAVVLPPLFGFMSLSRRKGLAIVASIPPAFGAMMLTVARVAPERFDPRVEALHFAILTTCMTALGVLLWQISGQRDHCRRQQVELSVALERLEAISMRDELTGLFNRRHMTRRLEDEIDRRARGGAAFCVCLIDIDHFKRVNDVHGHARGDAVLQSFARVLGEGLRDTDVLGRWGGEEFLLLLPATGAAAGIERVEALRRHGAETADWHEVTPLRVRFSAGISGDNGGSAARMLDEADQALYRAKETGRDRVVAAAERQTA